MLMNKIRSLLGAPLKRVRERRRLAQNVERVKSLSAVATAKAFVIVDCGFNEGAVAEELLIRLPHFSLVGFEIQQELKADAERLKRRFPGRVEVIYAAVSSRTGSIEYYEPKAWGRNYKGGTTTLKAKVATPDAYHAPKSAPCIDFGEWLRSATVTAPFVFVKMDIEGAEYPVLEHLLHTHTIEFIDVLAVEWHAHKLREPERSHCLEIERRLRAHVAQRGRPVLLDWY
jgi:FkbM family methyltransferase